MTTESHDLAKLAADRLSTAVHSVLQLVDEPRARTQVVIFALTRMLSIAGHEIRFGMQEAGENFRGNDLECAQAAAEYVLARIGVILHERRGLQ